MPKNNYFPPEGTLVNLPYSLSDLKAAQDKGHILEGIALRCDEQHNLTVSLGAHTALIPREEAIHPDISGSGREIAVLSRVGKPVCFCVRSITADEKGSPRIALSRRQAQERALTYLLDTVQPGDILSARVTHLEDFGVFVDIGCGIVSLLPIEHISVSRISHPDQRFRPGQKLLVAVTAVDKERKRVHLTHKELLGSWMENASRFRPGETVRGVARSVQDYGVFVELAPNLSGLADIRRGVAEGDWVSVYLKSIQPERMKIKLQIIETLPTPATVAPLHYAITDGRLEHWVYSPTSYQKEPVETVFGAGASSCP